MNRSRLAALTAGAMFVVASALAPATALAAGTGSLSIAPSSISASTGSSFTVDVDVQASVLSSGAAASVNFDPSKLQISSVAKGADFNTATASWVLPSASTLATANASGHLPPIAAYYNDGTTKAAGTTLVLARVTFFVSACGNSTITLPAGPADGGILDGQAASYGDPLTVTGGSASVTVSCTGAPDPNTTTTNISGTVDAGFVALSCPASLTIPLVRNATNTREFACDVTSNIVWTLNANDPSTGPNKGHMVDPGPPVKALSSSMHVLSGPHADAVGNTVYDYDQNLATGGIVAGGTNSTSVGLTLSQFAAPTDLAGNYGIHIVFQAISGF